MYRLFSGVDTARVVEAFHFFRGLPQCPWERAEGRRYRWRWLASRGYVCPVGALLYTIDPSYPHALLVSNYDELAGTVLADVSRSDFDAFCDDYDGGLIPDLAVAMGAATLKVPAQLELAL